MAEIHVAQIVNQFYFSVFCVGGNYANLGLAATKEGWLENRLQYVCKVCRWFFLIHMGQCLHFSGRCTMKNSVQWWTTFELQIPAQPTFSSELSRGWFLIAGISGLWTTVSWVSRLGRNTSILSIPKTHLRLSLDVQWLSIKIRTQINVMCSVSIRIVA